MDQQTSTKTRYEEVRDRVREQVIELLAFDVPTFCAAHGISRAHLYDLWDEGRGPARMRVGRMVLISREAAEAWRREIERTSGGEAA
jgi:predicted DNA-binding transcriptional regulator AlpA